MSFPDKIKEFLIKAKQLRKQKEKKRKSHQGLCNIVYEQNLLCESK